MQGPVSNEESFMNPVAEPEIFNDYLVPTSRVESRVRQNCVPKPFYLKSVPLSLSGCKEALKHRRKQVHLRSDFPATLIEATAEAIVKPLSFSTSECHHLQNGIRQH